MPTLAISIFISEFGFYLGGAYIYVKQFPECVWPGKFDIWVRSIGSFDRAPYSIVPLSSNMARVRVSCIPVPLRRESYPRECVVDSLSNAGDLQYV